MGLFLPRCLPKPVVAGIRGNRGIPRDPRPATTDINRDLGMDFESVRERVYVGLEWYSFIFHSGLNFG
jgi:hypothetical protein